MVDEKGYVYLFVESLEALTSTNTPMLVRRIASVESHFQHSATNKAYW